MSQPEGPWVENSALPEPRRNCLAVKPIIGSGRCTGCPTPSKLTNPPLFNYPGGALHGPVGAKLEPVMRKPNCASYGSQVPIQTSSVLPTLSAQLQAISGKHCNFHCRIVSLFNEVRLVGAAFKSIPGDSNMHS